MTKLSKFRLSSASHQVMWVRFHWNYICMSNLLHWKARERASNCGCIVWTTYQSSVVFRK